MVYVLFVVISLGNNNYIINYERNLYRSECIQIADVLNGDSEYRASCQVMNPVV